MLSRDQVLHVARLARLELTDDELDRHAGELSKVVDWIDKISELGDLADVAPTSHVVELDQPAARRRAPHEPGPGRRARPARPTRATTASACPAPGAGAGGG